MRAFSENWKRRRPSSRRVFRLQQRVEYPSGESRGSVRPVWSVSPLKSIKD